MNTETPENTETTESFSEVLADKALVAFAKGIRLGVIGVEESPQAMLSELKQLLMATADYAMEKQRNASADDALCVLTEEMNTIDEARNLGFRARVKDAILNAKVEL